MVGFEVKLNAFRPFLTVVWSFLLAAIFASADRSLKREESLSQNGTGISNQDSDSDLLTSFVNFIWQANKSGYQHVWPDMKFDWQIVVGSIIGFLGASFGSVGGVGGGGIFVPMLSLIIGFDPKSSTAISKCMIMGASVSTVYYNLKRRHPTLDMPIIDYDLAVLIQPMLMLGISIGVAFNVLFADWMVTALLIILFIGTSTKAFLKGVETWKKETIMKKEEAAKRLETNGDAKDEAEYKLLPGGPSNNAEKEAKKLKEPEVGLIENVCWKECGLLVLVWVAFLALQLIKVPLVTFSFLIIIFLFMFYNTYQSFFLMISRILFAYWPSIVTELYNYLFGIILGGEFATDPSLFGSFCYEAVCLYKGWRKIASKGESGSNLKVHQLLTYGFFGTLAGMVGGLLGMGGGFIMGPLFLELGVPPQVSSATATFAMMFSSSMSVVEYYLLKRFPVPYALYFVAVATVAAFTGQHVLRKLIIVLGRASIIIFILASTIIISAISLGGIGVSNTIGKIQRHEYMGFENLCKYNV